MNHTADVEAGPSRPRQPSDTDGQPPLQSSPQAPFRPASPETALHTPPRPSTPHLDLATYPTTTLLRLLASLLQQIASSNDQLRPELDDLDDQDDTLSESSQSISRSSSTLPPHPSPTTTLFETQPPPSSTSTTDEIPLFSASRTSLSHPSSLLSFHARHVPSISIEAYLLRILKYCPTTNEVFLGLLVYFDRMSRLGTPAGVGGESAGAKKGIGRGFAIDSYNVHRLVIAGVTVASKFFSDVFYTNSRYAKVGGLPPHELNQLELQFLLLNDFRLVIPPDEMQRYGDRLLGYWEGKDGEEGENGVTEPQSQDANVQTDAQVEKPTEAPRKEDAMEVDKAEPNGQVAPDPTPPAQTVPATTPSVAPRGRERDRHQPSVTFAEPPRPRGGGGSMRDWARGEEPIGGVIGSRMTSPMRD